jgi:hypothetical protein
VSRDFYFMSDLSSSYHRVKKFIHFHLQCTVIGQKESVRSERNIKKIATSEHLKENVNHHESDTILQQFIVRFQLFFLH